MNIAVYCGASTGNSIEYKKITQQLGDWIGQNKYNLVYGGGNVGLMGLIADSVLESGQNVIGVMPKFLVQRELAKDNLTTLEIVADMHERKKRMIDLADVYIALPGGPGTLEEITEVISWGRIGQHSNPCILMNQTSFFNPLREQFELMVKEGFLNQDDLHKILFLDSLEQLEPFIENFTPPETRKYK